MPTITRTDTAWVFDLGADENRFSPPWLDSAEDQLGQVAADPEVLPLITSGQDKFFSNGLDLEWVLANRDQFHDYVARTERFLAAVLTLPVPTIAAINGHAFGAGAMLAMCHDQRVMRTDRGFFCLPEVDLPLPFTPGMQALLTSTLPASTARVAMTTGRRFGGEAAVAAGIVEAAVTIEELPATAAAMVEGLAGKDAANLGNIKSALFAEVVAKLGSTAE
ncbi:enoyl-CoA hydratase-related protein [Naumannella halotolerans]|uniref:Enoyl-CoA hydratase/carnithine racemase n=1 Tax=Naumannella halotolerans TaxID=993414 RepID=A0A4R7J7W3_9ACTN|nr:enoyl-CoA hydratase-related protein [Naumannella halotolerans]TDT32597.1 enoyl-CoA hydratase/carnithine racemase [Naumannella halotolerans]